MTLLAILGFKKGMKKETDHFLNQRITALEALTTEMTDYSQNNLRIDPVRKRRWREIKTTEAEIAEYVRHNPDFKQYSGKQLTEKFFQTFVRFQTAYSLLDCHYRPKN